MRNKLKILFAVIIVALIVAKIFISAAINFYPPIIENEKVSIDAKNIIKLTNEYRNDLGLGILKENPRLDQAAINKARDILINGYFDHTSPEGKKFSEWIKDVNYKYFYVGENLAIDFENDDDVFNAWLKSPEHEENISKPQYQEIGVAAVKGKINKRQTIVVVQLFGSRVLGTGISPDDDKINTPIGSANNYFYETPWWQKTFNLERLENLNILVNYLLTISLAFFFFTYERKKIKKAINIKQPIINRYQANVFRE